MNLTKLSNDQKKKLVVRLSWWILEQKLMYYNPEYGKCVSDELYDREEIKYKEACEDLGLEPTASNNVGFPWDTGAGRLIVSKFQNKLPKNVKTLPVLTSNPYEVVETRKRIRKRTRSTEEPKRVRTRTRNNSEEEIKRTRTRPRKRSP